ncbi:GIY-YIG nuclease family protein [Methylotenera versatilis]|uniref:Excinuclease ABC C subunit domain protein n=1 Tax=Methylotenera versatilis (strain 301) TaxID=666681 RepID=D7DNC9_METV0|nr:GIY-YIG nuclease family protein [Methylotenera versatilis]ADI30930.1 Excinuclease ABC C subunit domain protein [Methylotenera versatilis 301]
MIKQPALYIIASKYNGTLYIGVTSNLPQRMYQHREGLIDGFSKNYGIKILVYFEMFEDMQTAIAREKTLKGITRAKKITLIESANPNWEDLTIKLELLKP